MKPSVISGKGESRVLQSIALMQVTSVGGESLYLHVLRSDFELFASDQ